MKPLYRYASAGLLVFLLSLTFSCPAPLLYQWQFADDTRVRAYALTGTLWQGSAGLLDASGVQLTSVEWQLRPLALLLGRLSHSVRASSETGAISAVVSQGFISTSIQDARGNLPVGQLIQALRLPVLPLPGRTEVAISKLRFSATGLDSAQGMLDLKGLQWPLTSPPSELGNYHVEMSTQNGTININLGDTAGPIELKGKAELKAANTYKFDVRLRPRATAPAPVVNVIQQLGNVDSEGWYRLSREGVFRP